MAGIRVTIGHLHDPFSASVPIMNLVGVDGGAFVQRGEQGQHAPGQALAVQLSIRTENR
jgi:hypothetical protein